MGQLGKEFRVGELKRYQDSTTAGNEEITTERNKKYINASLEGLHSHNYTISQSSYVIGGASRSLSRQG